MDKGIKKLAESFLLRYLQSWRQSIEEKIGILNQIIDVAGIKATYVQDDNKAGWQGEDYEELERASEMRKELHKCWPLGQFEWEADAIYKVIMKYKKQ